MLFFSNQLVRNPSATSHHFISATFRFWSLPSSNLLLYYYISLYVSIIIYFICIGFHNNHKYLCGIVYFVRGKNCLNKKCRVTIGGRSLTGGSSETTATGVNPRSCAGHAYMGRLAKVPYVGITAIVGMFLALLPDRQYWNNSFHACWKQYVRRNCLRPKDNLRS